ncbi:hypothetical protein GCM10009557_61280 [Virgisporangium ochraceum]
MFVAGVVAFLVSIFGTPIAMRQFIKLKADQPIRDYGPQTHLRSPTSPVT